MNKKIYGMMAVGIAAGFWACGSGDILTPNEFDGYMSIVNDSITAEGAINSTVMSRETCPACFEGTAPSSSSATPPPSSPGSSSSRQPVSSSSERTIGSSSSKPVESSSSFRPFPSNSSSSTGTSASSSSGGSSPSGVIGTCAPTTASAEAGGKVTWKFTRDPSVSAQQLMNATFSWKMDGANPATATASGANGLSQTVTYATSGTKMASVVVNIGASPYTVECTPLQVNGEKINGCKCSTEATSIDYTNPATPSASWAVTGCTTGAGLSLAYEWDGALGESTFTKTFTAAAASYAPTLRVANTDNTVIDVTCPAIKVTEGPEYTIKDNTTKVTFPEAGTYNVVIAYACQNKQFYCNGSSGPVGGSVNGVTMTSSWYTTVDLTAADCSGNATVVVEVDGAATCGAQ